MTFVLSLFAPHLSFSGCLGNSSHYENAYSNTSVLKILQPKKKNENFQIKSFDIFNARRF